MVFKEDKLALIQAGLIIYTNTFMKKILNLCLIMFT